MIIRFGLKIIGILLEFLYLGKAINLITPFYAYDQKALLIGLQPTLSPEDSNFQKWWEEHRSDWEREGFPESWGINRLETEHSEQKDGQEPADD